MKIETVDKINKSVILGSILVAILVTSIMTYLTNGVASVSWQIYQLSKSNTEIPTILTAMIIRWLTLLECGKYEL